MGEADAWKSTGDTTEIYGEVAFEGMQHLLDIFDWGAHAHFYDLGCGTGRLVLYAALTRNLGRAVGVDKVAERISIGEQAVKNLDALRPSSLHWARPELIDANFADVNFSDATAVYLSSLYFPDDVMRTLAERLCELPDGVRIAAMTVFPQFRYGKRSKLPDDSPLLAIQDVKKIEIAMSWTSEGVPIYVYEIDRRAARRERVRAVKGSAPTREVLETICIVADADCQSWLEEADTFMLTLTSTKIVEQDKVAVMNGQGDITFPLRVLLAILNSEANDIVAVSKDDEQRKTVVKIVGLLRDYAPGHIAWHRRVIMADNVPADASVVFAAHESLPEGLLGPATLVVGSTGCLPGLKLDEGKLVILAPFVKDKATIESLLGRGEQRLTMDELTSFFPEKRGMSSAQMILRLNRFASILGVPSGARGLSGSNMADWLKSVDSCA